MREIGSEFWNVPTCNLESKLFPDSVQWFLSGRSALQAIISDLKNCCTVSMPSWCCDSMVKPFIDAGINVRFYPVYYDGELVQEVKFDSDILFLMDYFGYSSHLLDLSRYNGVVIRDLTHSIFSATYSDADYYFGSLRKWCGVLTGGYAWSKDGHKIEIETERNSGEYISLREIAMSRKAEYISGLRQDKEYLNMFNEAEELLENAGIVMADERDIKLAMMLDTDYIRAQRRANAAVLRAELDGILIFSEMKNQDTPMFVPILVRDGKRDELRRYLINNEIYCPVHWPVSKYHKLDERTEFIYKNELSLVCDQRYTKEDMYRMVDVIKRFWKEA
ncbi:hypothetical protein [Oribacterium sp. P6A1]|uniref:hypothetical protein n=1 Tax=Oribacterium sp. P6A1 TaxID=1410612 RepID=UPI00056026BD|nr:hypothetical protein [Oribacterium sp. P6A1]